jgi:hypothetical protein
MVKLRHLLWHFLISATLVTGSALAQSTLTEIRDTIDTAAGNPFNGTVVITWNGYSGPNGSVQSPLSMSASIYNGALSVLLVPTTTASGGAFYQVVYNSSDGSLTWSETWQVPPSPVPLTVANVRVSTTQGGSGSGSGSGGSGSGQYATLPISISEVTGLSNDLAAFGSQITALNTTLASLSATVQALQSSSGATGSVGAAFVDAETPAGTLNGANNTFSLSQMPAPPASLAVYRNGLIQTAGLDYTLLGNSMTFLSGATPEAGDTLIAYYRVAGASQTVNFADSEIPGGAINGTNTAFSLLHAPNPAASVKLYKNGILLQNTADYTLSGSAITMTNAPQQGDALLADYRY